MKPENITTKIFLDSGSAKDTHEVIEKIGFLDGQTTNPSLFVKNPDVQERLARGEKFSQIEIHEAYKKLIRDIRELIPEKSVSIEVYADEYTSVEEILEQARDMNTWVPNPHIKLPITAAGLQAAHILSNEDVKINMTLIFQQDQAAAVYSATSGAQKGDIFLSPFVGRLDDIGVHGLDFIERIEKMYDAGDSHVEVLMASVRGIEHFIRALELKVDIITAPKHIIMEWYDRGMPTRLDIEYQQKDLERLPYQDISLEKEYTEYNLQHELTEKGLKKFADDWNNILEK